MKITINHRFFITTGLIIWFLSFFGEVSSFQPYSTVGILISPIFIIIGLFYWFKFYKSSRGYYPKFWTVWKENLRKMRSNPFAGIVFLLKHIIETWTIITIFFMLFVLVGYFALENSEAFKTIKKHCESNKEILAKTGKIYYYGILISGKITRQKNNGFANFSFTIVGKNGNFSANSELTELNNQWTVETLTIE